MEDWGKYIKNAVANVEQQLDKVLLENKIASPVSKQFESQPAPRSFPDKRKIIDLSERLKQASNGRSSHDSSHSFNSVNTNVDSVDEEVPSFSADPCINSSNQELKKSLDDANSDPHIKNGTPGRSKTDENVEIVSVSSFIAAPEFGSHLNKARRLALETHREDALGLVDGLEVYQKEINDFEENVTCRLMSANSKLSVLSRAKLKDSSGLERQIAMLVEEGTRLSKRELDLSTTVKKLRADRQAALKKSEQLFQKDAEIQSLKDTVEDTKRKLLEMEAEVEHYRSINESPSEPLVQERMEGAESSGLANRIPLETDAKAHLEERERWHKVETELLSRIAELEQNQESRSAVNTQLQQRLLDAQKAARNARDEQAALQDEFDTFKLAILEKEENLKARLRCAEEKLLAHERNEDSQRRKLTEVHSLERSINSDQNLKTSESVDSNLLQLVHSSSPHPRDGFSSQMSHTFSLQGEKHYEADSDLNSFDQNQVALGPSGPFGTLAEDFDPFHQPSGDKDFQELNEDGSSFLDKSRRESSILGSEIISGSQLHLIRKLTSRVRRLESELSTAQKAAELAKQQRLDAQAEIARLIEVQEELENVKTVNESLCGEVKSLKDQLKIENSTKAEHRDRIEELEADIRDLKDMYKEQIEALISTIESLTRAH